MGEGQGGKGRGAGEAGGDLGLDLAGEARGAGAEVGDAAAPEHIPGAGREEVGRDGDGAGEGRMGAGGLAGNRLLSSQGLALEAVVIAADADVGERVGRGRGSGRERVERKGDVRGRGQGHLVEVLDDGGRDRRPPGFA